MQLHIQQSGWKDKVVLDRENYQLDRWTAVLSRTPLEGGEEYALTVTAKQNAKDATITVSAEQPDWSRENYVFAPAGMYSGNRFKSLPLEYPPIAVGNVDDVPDPEIVITDVPRLSREGESKIELMAGDLTKPLFGYFSPAKKKAFFFLFTQQSFPGRDNSIRVEEREDAAEFALVVPARRSKAYYFMHSDTPQHRPGH